MCRVVVWKVVVCRAVVWNVVVWNVVVWGRLVVCRLVASGKNVREGRAGKDGCEFVGVCVQIWVLALTFLIGVSAFVAEVVVSEQSGVSERRMIRRMRMGMDVVSVKGCAIVHGYVGL